MSNDPFAPLASGTVIEDTICVIVPTPRVAERIQRKHLIPDGCRAVRVCTGKTWCQQLLRVIRAGTLVKVFRLHLLADRSKARLKGGLIADLIRVIDQIEERGAHIKEVETGLLTSRSRDKNAMLERAAITFRLGSKEPTGRVGGRRKLAETYDERQREIIAAEWHSRKHKTNAAAVAAMAKRGVKITENQCWKLEGASGRSAPKRRT